MYATKEFKMKSDKFRSLAERRVNNAIKQIRLVGNLANPNSYEYTEEQVRNISRALKTEIDTMQSRFKSASSSNGESAFTL